MLPLPYIIARHDTLEQANDKAQANFDTIKRQFPLGRRHMKIETPTVVGSGAPAPAFQSSWVNYDTAVWERARFWKDPVGIVHIEGLVKNGGSGTIIFTLPVGYRPSHGHIISSPTDTGVGRLDVQAAGNVVHSVGGTGFISLKIQFLQEQ